MKKMRFFVIVLFVISSSLYIWVMLDEGKEESHSPVITNTIDELEIKIKERTDVEKLLKGLEANDKEDGNLTDQIIVDSVSDFIEPAIISVSYSVTDRDGNITVYRRKVRCSDYKSPTFTIIKEPVCMLGEMPNMQDYVSVEDSVDGDLTDKIEVVSIDMDAGKEGIYPVTLEVVNSLGEKVSYCMYMIVKVSTSDQAKVRLTQYSTIVKKGMDFDPEDYIDEVINGYGEAMYDPVLNIENEVDMNTPGIYPVIYQLADYHANTNTVLMVEVTE